MSDKKSIINVVVTIVKARKSYPTLEDMKYWGITREVIRQRFGSLSELLDEAYPLVKDYVLDLDREKPRELKNKKRFVITSATIGQKIHLTALKNLKTYCRILDAELIIIPCKGEGKGLNILDPSVRNGHLAMEEIELNSNIKVLPLFQKGSKTDPVSGLPRLGKRDASYIVGSTKQRLVYTATGIHQLPHATMSTGSITLPNYNIKSVSGYAAEHDHVMGAVIVEVAAKEKFHFRQIQFGSRGEFVDLGTLVDGVRTKTMYPEAMVLGDWHSGKTCPITAKASYKISKELAIPEWIVHDVYDSHSANHHEIGKLLLLSRKARSGELNLTDELKGLADDLNQMTKALKKVTIVKSNHDEFLDRYLDSGAWMKHPHNTELCLELASAMIGGESPVKYAVEKFGLMSSSKINWLKRDESYKIAGIETGCHGDKGANGSRGSATALENAFGKCVFGHSHSPQILRDAWCVGTSTLPYPDYGTGPTSWMNTHCLIYPNGMRQMINFIDGEYTTRKL